MNHEAITTMTDEILDDRHEYPNIIRRMLDDDDGMESFYELVKAWKGKKRARPGSTMQMLYEREFYEAAETVCEDLRGGADELSCDYLYDKRGLNGQKRRGEVA